MGDFEGLIRDPEFQSKPWNERHAILTKVSPDGYAKAPPAKQADFMNEMKQQSWWQGGAAGKPATPAPTTPAAPPQSGARKAWDKWKKVQAEPFKLAAEGVTGLVNTGGKVLHGLTQELPAYLGSRSAGMGVADAAAAAGSVTPYKLIESPLGPSMTGQAVNKVVGAGINKLGQVTGQPELVQGIVEAGGDIASLYGLKTGIGTLRKAATGTTNKLTAKGAPFTTKRAEFRAGEILNDVEPVHNALTGMRKTLGKGAAELPEQVAPQVTGDKILSRAGQAKELAKKTRDKAYKDLGNPSLPIAPIQKEVDALKSEFRAGDAEVHPISFLNDYDRMVEKYSPKASGILDANGKPIKAPNLTTVPFEELDSLRKEIGRQLEVDTYGMNPNLTRAKKLLRLKSAIDETIDTNLEHSAVYKKARDIHSQYMKTYREGPVGEVLAKGNRSTGLRTPVDKVPDKLYTPEGVDGLVKAVGRDGAAEEMMPHVTDRLIKNTVDANTGLMNIPMAMKFVAANKPLLEKLGTIDKVNGLVKSQVLKSIEAEFEKSGEVLGMPAMNAKRTRALIRMYGKSVEDLFGKEGMEALTRHGEAMNALKQLYLKTMNVEDMASLVGSFRREKYGVFTGVAEDAARFAAVERGHGWQFSSVRGLIMKMADPVLGLSDAKVGELLLRAERDPDLAKVLRKIPKAKPAEAGKLLAPFIKSGVAGEASNIVQPQQPDDTTIEGRVDGGPVNAGQPYVI